MPCSRSLVSYICARPIWPTAAAAWSSFTSCGRVVQPRRFMPSAIAPLETMTTSGPSRASAASWRDHSPMATSSRPLPSLVTRLEPTFTTMRRASRTTPARGLVSDILEAAVDFFGRLLGLLHFLDVLEDRLDERVTAFAGKRGNFEHR